MKIQRYILPVIIIAYGAFFCIQGSVWLINSINDHTGWVLVGLTISAGLLLNGMAMILLAIFYLRKKLWAKIVLIIFFLVEFLLYLAIRGTDQYFLIPYGLIILPAICFLIIFLLIFGKKIFKDI
jgi:hypothetical protein